MNSNLKHGIIIAFFFLINSISAQSVSQEKMKSLNFMIGEWIGTTKVFEDGVVSAQGSAYQKISYDLDKSILVIELNSELLQLHTIIGYDKKDDKYYYYPFSKRGVAKYSAEFKDDKLIVWSNENNRYIFSKTADNGLREHGEKLVDGNWIKYFEDNFKNSQ